MSKTSGKGQQSKKSKKAPRVNKKEKPVRRSARVPASARFPIIGVGASAGGLEAYLKLFGLLPPNTGMAFVLVQHLAPKSMSLLSSLVQKSTQMKVQEIEDGMVVKPNNVYVIPPNFILEIFHGILHLRPMPMPPSTGHLVDTFFSSLAQDHRHLAVGIVLSGTGSDGSQGLLEIKASGGISLVQDPLSAKYDGMPRMAIKADHPDCISSVAGLVKELLRIAANPVVDKILSVKEKKLTPEAETYLRKIFITIRANTGTDFSAYKHPTILRRIKRRMVLNAIESIKHYHSFLQSSPAEVKALFSDLIINVTEFFRDPEAFESLKARVFPEILKDHPTSEPLRIWVPGCSTGEEVYSIAISLLEYLGESKSKYPVQIYGTDVSDIIIKKARMGIYSESITEQVSQDRLEHFFVKEADGYRVSKVIRDCCIFSVQDVTSDPPIHRLHLLSCRNLMIYLEPAVQKRLLETFFYALNQNGFLLLGSSESVGTSATMFATVDEKSKIYLKRGTAVPPRRSIFDSRRARRFEMDLSHEESDARLLALESDPVVKAEKLVLEKYAPAWMLVNDLMDIIHLKGNTGNFIMPRSGQASWSLAKMLKEELVADVRVLLHAAQKKEGATRKEGISVQLGRATCLVDVEAVSLEPVGADRYYLVLFYERSKSGTTAKKVSSRDPEVKRLRIELASTQKSLRSFLDDQSSTNEELQSANEEVLSANEELQSTNEELETAKEELQSTNEELVTVNEELSQRNLDLSRANDDISNVLTSAHAAIVMVTSELVIRRLTPAAGKLLNLGKSDIGRRLIDFNLGFPMDVLEEKLLDVIQNLSTVEIEVDNRNKRHYSIFIRPYKTSDSRIDGAVLTFIDSTQLKNKERAARRAEKYSDAIIQTIHDPILVLNQDLKIERVNESFYRTFKVNRSETEGKSLYQLGNGQWDIPELRQLLKNILSSKSNIRDFEVIHNFENIGQKTMLINAQCLVWEEQPEALVLLAIRDVTDRPKMTQGE